jgi:hypothetical protein
LNPIQLFDPASSTYTYLLVDEATRAGLIIDPVDQQLERDLALLREHGIKLAWSVEPTPTRTTSRAPACWPSTQAPAPRRPRAAPSAAPAPS